MDSSPLPKTIWDRVVAALSSDQFREEASQFDRRSLIALANSLGRRPMRHLHCGSPRVDRFGLPVSVAVLRDGIVAAGSGSTAGEEYRPGGYPTHRSAGRGSNATPAGQCVPPPG